MYIKRPTCHPVMKIWTLGWHNMREMQEKRGMKEMLANVMTQTRVSDVFML